jgi:hypothetical protein
MYSVCIDISAKIEAWDKDSIVAIANDHREVYRGLRKADSEIQWEQIEPLLSNQ